MIHHELHRLLNFAVQQKLIGEEDRVYAGNQLAGILGVFDFDPDSAPLPAAVLAEQLDTPTPILDILLDDAVRRGFLGDTPLARDSFDTRLMNCLTPRPSEVIARFWADYDELPDKATSAFYQMGIASNYIRKDRMDRNEVWHTPTPYGDLCITINMSKPEKDPRDIAAAGRKITTNYPGCLLCRQNEGFYGIGNHPARHNLRLIPLLFRGERWFFQYSPYGYYNEHCIVLNEQHTPMRISRETFDNFIQFLCLMPHYMIGSNADLPIVGGSILAHDHYQGGRHVFPMDLAKIEKAYKLKDFPAVDAGRLCWPMSTLRLRSIDKHALVDAAAHILEAWHEYSDHAAGILATTGQEPHNTISPVARMRGNEYEMDLVLRNNRTSLEHPLGIFHPHADVHHIKKENIGIIEVLGLAILPPRLKTSLALLAEAWRQGRDSVADTPELHPHARWYADLRARHVGHVGHGGHGDEVETLLRQEVGNVFLRVLEDCGVFARTPEGAARFDRFVENL